MMRVDSTINFAQQKCQFNSTKQKLEFSFSLFLGSDDDVDANQYSSFVSFLDLFINLKPKKEEFLFPGQNLTTLRVTQIIDYVAVATLLFKAIFFLRIHTLSSQTHTHTYTHTDKRPQEHTHTGTHKLMPSLFYFSCQV